MDPSRRWAAVLLLPIIMLLSTLADYGSSPAIYDLELEELGRAEMLVRGRWLLLGGMAAGALGAVLVGPWGVLAFGLMLASGGYLLGLSDPIPFELAIGLANVGEGIARPALWAAAIVVFARPYEAARMGLCLLLWGVMNLGGGAVQLGNDMLWQRGRRRPWSSVRFSPRSRRGWR